MNVFGWHVNLGCGLNDRQLVEVLEYFLDVSRQNHQVRTRGLTVAGLSSINKGTTMGH